MLHCASRRGTEGGEEGEKEGDMVWVGLTVLLCCGQVTIVACVRNKIKNTTNMSFVMEDGTGQSLSLALASRDS